jgi:anti-sigma factor RsiW
MTQLFSDETLTAYLDDELPPDARDALGAALEDDPLLRARLQALSLDRGALRMAFDSVLPEAPAAPYLATAAPANRRVPLPAAMLAAAACLCLGLFIGFTRSDTAAPSPGSDWKLAVAQYQLLYVPETLAMTREATAQNLSNLPNLSQALGRDLSAAAQLDSLEFRRAQMLGLNGEPLIQMAYTSEGGVPFAICVTRVEGEDYAPVEGEIEGLAAAHWVRDGYGYIVIGGQDQSLVAGVAEELQAQI